MKQLITLTVSLLSLIILSSFLQNKDAEEIKLKRSEQKVLQANTIGKAFTFDFTGRKNCNKSKIKYLGVAQANGKQYKILTSFFVYSTGEYMCQGTSNIKIYDLKN